MYSAGKHCTVNVSMFKNRKILLITVLFNTIASLMVEKKILVI